MKKIFTKLALGFITTSFLLFLCIPLLATAQTTVVNGTTPPVVTPPGCSATNKGEYCLLEPLPIVHETEVSFARFFQSEQKVVSDLFHCPRTCVRRYGADRYQHLKVLSGVHRYFYLCF